MRDQRDEGARAASETARLETFADGVMAIAITLLILEVKVPRAAGGRLGHALADQWPSYAGYLVSFLTIGIIWVNHHHMFKLIERVDHAFLMLNVVFLIPIAFLPFPTALVADYIRDPHGRTVAAATYGLTMVCLAVMFNVVWNYASGRRGLLVEGVSDEFVRKSRRNYMVGPTVYGAATIVALFNAFASLAIYAALAVYWLLPGTGPRANAMLPTVMSPHEAGSA